MTGRDVADDGRMGRTRREVLAAAGAAGVVGLAGCSGDGDGPGATPTATPQPAYANMPVEGDTVTIGVSVPETGVYSGEGAQLRVGYELAAMNINQDRGYSDEGIFPALAGSPGVRGKEIEIVTGNTGSDTEQARESAQTLIDTEGAVMLAGGASSDEAIAHQGLANDRGVIHMVGFAPGNSIGGENCAVTGFQEMFNAAMAANALKQALIDEHGFEATFAQVRPRSDVGESFATSIAAEMAGEGWQELATETTRVGTQDFREQIQSAAEESPDVLVLNYYGLDGAHALTQADELVGGDVDIVVPLYNRPMARNAGGAMEDVLGTIHWESAILQENSRKFTNAWRSAYASDDRRAQEPSGLAHLAYSQLFQWAAAVERAGSFRPPDVAAELSGHTYDLGMGEETMRECDHQAQRPIPIVTGLAEDQQYWGRYYEFQEILTGVGYGCDEDPAADCELGSI
jgi:ABC-type branched-subunit amino acid transport system substrate-binding protein